VTHLNRRALVLSALLVPASALARNDDGRFDASPHREWFEGLKVPGGGSCCGLGDAHFTNDYEIGKHGVAQVRVVTPDGKKREFFVPPERVLMREALNNPTGQGVIFLSPGWEAAYCFVPTAQS